jgi:hypothetical protein
MLRLALVLALVVQSGCAAAVYGESRKVTREGIAPALPAVAPGMPAEAASRCMMAGLTQIEIVSLPNSGTFDDPARTEAFAREVAARPGVAACLGAGGPAG